MTPVYPDVTPLFRIVGSLLFGGLALVFLGLGMMMVYEVIAIYTRKEPTISLVTSFEYLHHPVWWVVILAMLMFSLGALVTHFTHWTP